MADMSCFFHFRDNFTETRSKVLQNNAKKPIGKLNLLKI